MNFPTLACVGHAQHLNKKQLPEKLVAETASSRMRKGQKQRPKGRGRTYVAVRLWDACSRPDACSHRY